MKRLITSVPRAQSGVTVVEMMVAILVGLILMAGIIQLFVSNKKAYRLQEGVSVLNENARYTMNQMQYDLRMADHWGGSERGNVEILPGGDNITGDCGGNAAAILAVGMFGFDGGGTSPLACIPSSDFVPNSDVLVLRYADPKRVASGSLLNSTMYLRSAIGRRAVIFEGRNKASLPGDIAPANAAQTDLYAEDPTQANYALRTVIYFLRPCASQALGTPGVCDAADDTTPTLARLTLQGTTLVEEDVIAGVEQMQFSYGVDTNGDRSAELYRNAAEITANNEWAQVVSVRMSVLIRNAERDPGYSDSSTYQLYGGAGGTMVSYTVPAAARQFHRKIFNSTIQIRNMSRG